MLPDYLPIIHMSRSPGDPESCSRLFDALLEEIAQKGVRVGMVERLVQQSKDMIEDGDILQSIVNSDLLVVNGQCDRDCAKLYLGHHAGIEESLERMYPRFTCSDISDAVACADTVFNWLTRCMKSTPLWGCVLIGGRSSRMGSPKHLIDGGDGKSWLEQSVDLLSSQVARIVISGEGDIPQVLNSLKRIDDLPGLSGPMAGISAVIKQYPFVSWIVMACDMPDITVESIRWLIEQRRPGRLAVIPRNPITDRGEPLYGWYDFRCAPLFDQQAGKGEMRMNRLGKCVGVCNPVIPGNLVSAWRNVNRPEELDHPPLTQS
jgi:molybdopterin-guanine dinucleotide biosynthesis protein A